jgi:transposase-like protein
VASDPEERWCYELLRRTRWPDGVTCPYCGARHATTHSKPEATPRRRYLCLGCRRTFSDLTGTPLARTNLPLATWVACLRRLRDPQTSSELAKRLGVKWETAMRMQRRLAVALDRPGLICALRDAVAATQGIAQRPPAPGTPR